MTMLQHNYQSVLARIADEEAMAGREAGSVHLVAVSKTFLASDIRALYAAGQRDFGENYIREWCGKADELVDLPDIVWHIIGQVQSNKTRLVAERAHWVHTIDKLKTAERLSVQRRQSMPPLQVCVEVNIAREVNKHGVAPEDVLALALAVDRLPNLRLRGLMCVAQADAEREVLEGQFGRMADLLAQLQAAGLAVDVLSMGMSSDMGLAVSCGATHVRIGSAIFGVRRYKA